MSFTPFSVSLTNFNTISFTLLNAPEFLNFPYTGRLYDIEIAALSAQYPEWSWHLSSFLSCKYWKFFPSDSDMSHFILCQEKKCLTFYPCMDGVMASYRSNFNLITNVTHLVLECHMHPYGPSEQHIL